MFQRQELWLKFGSCAHGRQHAHILNTSKSSCSIATSCDMSQLLWYGCLQTLVHLLVEKKNRGSQRNLKRFVAGKCIVPRVFVNEMEIWRIQALSFSETKIEAQRFLYSQEAERCLLFSRSLKPKMANFQKACSEGGNSRRDEGHFHGKEHQPWGYCWRGSARFNITRAVPQLTDRWPRWPNLYHLCSWEPKTSYQMVFVSYQSGNLGTWEKQRTLNLHVVVWFVCTRNTLNQKRMQATTCLKKSSYLIGTCLHLPWDCSTWLSMDDLHSGAQANAQKKTKKTGHSVRCALLSNWWNDWFRRLVLQVFHDLLEMYIIFKALFAF